MIVSRLFVFLTALVMAVSSVSLTVSAAKVDMNYEGDIDPYTGLPADSESSTTDSGMITINSDVAYDRLSNKFLYFVRNSDQTVESNVLSGTVTTDAVSLSVPSDVSAVLYQNGRVVSDPNYSQIKEIGSYVLAILETDTKYQLIRFTVVPQKTGMLSVFQAPSECVILGATVNGERQRLTDRGRFDMSEDGEYAISYRCEAINRDYMLHLEIDHTPSQVVFNGVQDGKAKGSVLVEGLETTDWIGIVLDGQTLKLPEDNTLRTPGKYSVTIIDDAGNIITEEFVIEFYLNEQGWIFGLLFLAVIAAAVVYMLETKKRFRVR